MFDSAASVGKNAIFPRKGVLSEGSKRLSFSTNRVFVYLIMLRLTLISSLCLSLITASAVNLDSLWGVWNDQNQPVTNRLKAMHKIVVGGYLYSQPDSAFYFAQIAYDLAQATGNKKEMADALNIQGVSYWIRSNYKQALDYLDKSLNIKEEIGDKQGMAKSYNNIGMIYKNQGNYKQARAYYDKSLKMLKKMGDKSGMASSLGNIGVIYKNQGNYEQALEYYDKSLKMFKKMDDKSGMAGSLGNIGAIYFYQSNYERALEYMDKSLKIKEEIGDKKGMAVSYNNIGGIYYQQGNHDRALDYYDKSLKIHQEIGDKKGISEAYINIGNIHDDQGNYKQALDYYDKSLKIKEQLGDKKGMAICYYNLSFLFFGQENYTKALDLGNKSLALAQEVGALLDTRNASKLLYQVYKKTGQSSKELEMHELYIEMLDSINSIENKEAAIKLEYKHAYEKEQVIAEAKHQEQMALSAEREKRQQLIAYSAGGGLVMVLLFAFFIFKRLRVTRRQKKVIEEQKELVEEQKKDITDSIQYAENIQKALLPTIENLKDALPDGFVLFQPKDIVSGDFYWMQHHNDRVYFAACDCTGHGVPGAFMSMIGSSLLDEAVIEKGITKPSEIFFEVRKGFINALKQTGDTQKDGMDAVLCSWNKNGGLEYSLAYNPLLLIRKGEIIETKADKQPVGFHTGEQKPFTHHEHKLEKGDTIYLFSDGYPDQFGGKKDKKFMMKNFKKLLLSIQDKTMNEQKTILETTMAEWKGDTEQVDDILVIGVRF